MFQLQFRCGLKSEMEFLISFEMPEFEMLQINNPLDQIKQMNKPDPVS